MGIFSNLFESQKVAPPAFGQINQQSLLLPLYQQAFLLASAAGENPESFFKDALEPGFWIKKGVWSQKGAPGWLDLPGVGHLDLNKVAAKLPSLLEKVQAKEIESTQAALDKLEQTPAFAGLSADAKGKFSAQFTQSVSNAFDQLAQANLGGASAAGFLHDPLVQAKVLGPLALTKAQYEKGVQDQAQAALFNIAGVGALGGGSAAALNNPPSLLNLQGGIGQSANLFASINAQNAGLKAEAKANQASFAGGLAGLGAAGLGGLPWGSMFGGGGGYGSYFSPGGGFGYPGSSQNKFGY